MQIKVHAIVCMERILSEDDLCFYRMEWLQVKWDLSNAKKDVSPIAL